MIILKKALVCENVLIDKLSGRVSVINLIDDIYSEKTPVNIESINILTEFKVSEEIEEIEQRFEIVFANNLKFDKVFDKKIGIQKGSSKVRVISKIKGVPITEFGITKIYISVKIKEEFVKIGQVELNVIEVKKKTE